MNYFKRTSLLSAPLLLLAAGRLAPIDVGLSRAAYLDALSAAMFAGRQAGPGGEMQEIARAGTPAGAMGELPTFAEFVDFIGLPQVREAEQRYAVKAGPGTADKAGPGTADKVGPETGARDASDI